MQTRERLLLLLLLQWVMLIGKIAATLTVVAGPGVAAAVVACWDVAGTDRAGWQVLLWQRLRGWGVVLWVGDMQGTDAKVQACRASLQGGLVI